MLILILILSHNPNPFQLTINSSAICNLMAYTTLLWRGLGPLNNFCSLTGGSNTAIANVNRRIPNHNHVTSSTSNLKLSWTGDFQSLKDFVHAVLKAEGEWSSPGGETKLFTGDKVTLTWLRNKKYLSIRGKDEREVTYVVLSQLCGEPKEDRATNEAQVETVAMKQFRCNDLASECEGTKLELVIFESRVNRRIQENANNIAKLKCEFSDIIKSVTCKNQEKLSGDSRDNANVQVGVKEEYKLYGDKLNNLLDLCHALQTDVLNHKEDLTTTLHLSQIKLAESSTSLKSIESKVERGNIPMGFTTATQTESANNRTNYSPQVQSSLTTGAFIQVRNLTILTTSQCKRFQALCPFVQGMFFEDHKILEGETM